MPKLLNLSVCHRADNMEKGLVLKLPDIQGKSEHNLRVDDRRIM